MKDERLAPPLTSAFRLPPSSFILPLEALANFLLLPGLFTVSLASLPIAYFKRKFLPYTSNKRPILFDDPHANKSMGYLMRRLRRIPFQPKRGWSSLDFHLQFMADMVPSLLDMNPRKAGRFYPYPDGFRALNFTSQDGTPLAAYLGIHNDDVKRPGLIVMHGALGSSQHYVYSFQALRAFREWGFNVIAFDSRGFGKTAALSDQPPTLGWKEAEDVLAAARFLKQEGNTGKISGIGFSLGGSALLNAAAHREAPKLLSGGILSWSGFVDSDALLAHITRNPGFFHPYFLAYNIFRLAYRHRSRAYEELKGIFDVRHFFRDIIPRLYDITEEELYYRSSAIHRAKDIKVPCLLVHAEDDHIVPFSQAQRMQRAARGNPWVKVLVLPRGTHCAFNRVDPRWEAQLSRRFFEYWNDIRILNS
jgi:predicted alpha/beta-fold hydrolase